MNCLKCGKETEDEQAFCLECQKEMARYPVDPGAVVQLPTRRRTPVKKLAKRRITPEEQISTLRKRVRLYAGLFLAALVVIVCLAVPLTRELREERAQIGKNYSTVKPSTAATQAEEEAK